MDEEYPTISIVCPTYNSASFVAVTLQSVLAQTVAPFELIVSDDGSADDTVTVVACATADATFVVRILENPHRGPGAARNAGIRAATGEWIAFLDADDRWFPEKLACAVGAIATNQEANFLCHSERHLRRDGSWKSLEYGQRYRQDIPLPVQLYSGNLFSTSAVIVKRKTLMEHGMFDISLSSAQDYELWLRISPFLRVCFIREELGWYIDREGSISSTKHCTRFANELRALYRNRTLVGMAQCWYTILYRSAYFWASHVWLRLRRALH